ncbi:unnamed protein product [Paramecium octaurelia]|uniref:Uncharacterized protein n=1 Tax=Paramecium octaurelia TaxID=43137 RepID=A0A8S1TXM5_PAROT|nr:unnamed protein product [Paramecium octaurelia]
MLFKTLFIQEKTQLFSSEIENSFEMCLHKTSMNGSTEFIRILGSLKPEGVFKSFSYIQINFFNFYFLNASREHLGNLTLFQYQNYDYIISISHDFIFFFRFLKNQNTLRKTRQMFMNILRKRRKKLKKNTCKQKKTIHYKNHLNQRSRMWSAR